MPTRRYVILDVFTEEALTGNPLAVVLDGEDLTDAAMQAIAREFNLSETTFVQPPEKPGHTAKLRIFTPARELPFAGHPTVGSAIACALDRNAGTQEHFEALIALEEAIGSVRCGVTVRGSSGFAEFDLPKLPEQVKLDLDKVLIAEALGLNTREIGFENHLVTAWSAGVPYVFVPVHDVQTLGRITIRHSLFAEAFPLEGHAAAFVYARAENGERHAFRARMFAPEMGITEDPATGSAAAAFAGVVMAFDQPRNGEEAIVLHQGVEMGRPSQIHLTLAIEDGRLTGARIGGHAVRIAEGRLMTL
ncbi:MAG: PhzF family phenazine biosynthesis protein [Hyphomicrobiaceae bacterium]|nr:PhzF family phenazine biosynthesis protein [Hyphomicrobiaceae bacterium]